MHRNQVAGILAGGVALVCLITLLTPWWTVASGSGSVSARPFDGSLLVDSGKTLVAGLLVLGALLAAAAAACMLLLAKPKEPAALLVGGSCVLLVVQVILTWTTWPPEGLGFATSEFSVAVYPNVGWYFAILGALLAGSTAWAAWSAEATHMAPMTAISAQSVNPAAAAPYAAVAAPGAAGQCAATTKAGNRCARKATVGRFCTTHAV